MAFDLKPEPGDDIDLPEDGPAEGAESAAPAAPAASVETPPDPTGNGPTVSLAKPLSRRAQAEKERNEKIDKLAQTVESLSNGISQRDQQLAQMRGFMEAQALQPRYVAPQQQQPSLPDPVELRKRAKAALDAQKFDEFHELTIQAAEAQTLHRLAPALQELQSRQQQPNQMPPELGAMFAAYPDVAMHPRNIDFLQAKNLELHARGVPPGPERLRMVFAEVDAGLKGAKKNGGGAQYSPASAAVLSGMPTSRSNGSTGGSDGPGITLTAVEAQIAARLEKQGVMSKADYARGLAEADPSRVRA